MEQKVSQVVDNSQEPESEDESDDDEEDPEADEEEVADHTKTNPFEAVAPPKKEKQKV